MDDGVAYMVMGEGETTGQATQVVAVDNGDGTQQLAIPVMDPETGQETYMIIDPQTAQSIAEGNGNQQFIMMPGGGVQIVDTSSIPHNEEQLQMVMLPNGEQGLVVGQGGMDGIVQDKNGVQYVVTSDGEDLIPHTGHMAAQPHTQSTQVQYVQEPPVTNGHDSSMIRIVGIQDRKSGGVSVVKSTGTHGSSHGSSVTSIGSSLPESYNMETDLQRQPVIARAPRKQSHGTQMSDISQQEPGALGGEVPRGLTGDLFKDTELVEAKVRDICRKIVLSEPEKEKLRLNLMTKGLDSVKLDVGGGTVRMTSRGRGRLRGRGNARSGGARISRPAAARTIKCDRCKKEFPANVDESVLVHHIKTAHMVKPQETFTCDKCEKVLPTATALKYHTCADRFQCNECNKLFMQKSTLIQHQAVAHGPSQEPKEAVKLEQQIEEDVKPLDVEKSKPKPEIVKKLVDDWDEEDEEENEKRKEMVDIKREGGGGVVRNEIPIASSSTAVPERGVIKEEIGRVEKSEEVDEDQIVRDVDDILNGTEDIISDLENIAAGKPTKRKYSEFNEDTEEPPSIEEGEVIKALVNKALPTVQCEECYECFETEEKMTWHSLNDH